MAAPNSGAASGDSAHLRAGFAKLQGEKFEYYMQTYSITLGHNTEAYKVDFDLSELDEGKEGPHGSHLQARIFYDFECHHFALEVLGENGCSIQKVSDIDENGCPIKVSYLPGSDPVKLNSQDLIEIAGKKFYFLLPKRSILATLAAQETELEVSNSYRFNAGPARTQGESGMLALCYTLMLALFPLCFPAFLHISRKYIRGFTL